jgi:epithelial splicing regulatory protein 1/2
MSNINHGAPTCHPLFQVRAMEKDRAKFGPEYGDRFCMLQLVGRHEMDKVQLQKESEANAAAAKNGLLGSMTALQAAALATQAALQNPALQPLLMAQAAANPWFNPAALHLGLMGNPGVAALAGAGQLPPSIAGGLPGKAQRNAPQTIGMFPAARARLLLEIFSAASLVQLLV